MDSPLPTVLVIDNFLSLSGGSRSYSEDLAAQLELSGLTVITSSKAVYRPARLADMVLSALGLRGKYATAIVGVYSGRAFFWAEMAARAAKAAGKSVILVLHGGALPQFAVRNKRRVIRLLESAEAVVAPSPYLRESLACLRPDIKVIPNAINLGMYPFRPRQAVRPRLVWLRAFHQSYEPEMAVRVMAELRRTHPSAILSMYGVAKDESLNRSRQLAQKLGVDAMIRFEGVVPKSRVGEVLGAGDIFLNTTRVDNTPVSVIEAMACGLCVVSTNVGGIRYLLKDGVNGLLVPCGAPKEMAEAVRRLLEEPPLSHRLSVCARADAELFAWPKVIPQWLQLLQDIHGKL